MKVLIISANSLPAAPTGPLYVGGALRQAGHEVQIFERLFAKDLEAELSSRIAEFDPDVVGVSIRLVFGDTLDANAPLGTSHTDLRPRIKEVTDIVRRNTPARIVLGGPGFNYYARDWLEYLDLDYGIRGEGEQSFQLYLHRLEHGDDINTVPGCIYRKNQAYHTVSPQYVQDLDHQALPAYDLVSWQPYSALNVTPAIQTKRGCAFSCTYCPYCKLEGKRYRLKSPERVVSEARHIQKYTGIQRVMFCENNFNVPHSHALAICRAWSKENPGMQWGTGDLRPVGVTQEFCKLMEDSGCFYLNLSIESASPTMLKTMKRGYTVQQVRSALEALSHTNIPFSTSLMLGAPGETPHQIAETLSVLGDYDIPNGVWVTIGVYLWTDYQDIVAELRDSGQLKSDTNLFDGVVYLSQGLPKSYLRELPELLRARKNYSVQFNKPSQAWTL